MKTSKKIFFVVPTGTVLLLLVLFLSLTSCSNGSTDTADTPKVVEAKYRFSNGNWSVLGIDQPGAVSALGENTFTVSGGGIGISYTGVYTEGGGILGDAWPGPNTWAYLYDSSGKIGFAAAYNDGSYFEVNLGVDQLEYILDCIGDDPPDTDGMQNINNGQACR